MGGDNKYFIFKSEWYREGFIQYISEETSRPLREKLNTRKYSSSKCEQSSRVLNHLALKGVIKGQSDGTGWRRFSIVELVWLKIVSSARELGVPLEKLAITYKELFFESDEFPYSELEFAIVANLLGYPIDLIFLPESRVGFADADELDLSIKFGSIRHFSIVPITPLLIGIAQIEHRASRNLKVELTARELQIIAALRSEDYQNVEITKGFNNEPKIIVTPKGISRKANPEQVLRDIMKGGGKGDLTIHFSGNSINNIVSKINI